MNIINLNSENLKVDWLSFNLEGLMDSIIIANRLSKHFTPHVLIDNVPTIGFHNLKKKYKVSVRQYTGSRSYWVGTHIIFSGKPNPKLVSRVLLVYNRYVSVLDDYRRFGLLFIMRLTVKY